MQMRKIIRNVNILVLLIFLAWGAAACEKDEEGRRRNKNEAAIKGNEDELSRVDKPTEGSPGVKTDYFTALSIAEPVSTLPAIDFSVESLEGELVNLFDFKGKVVFLNFWATWCGPCKAEVEDIDILWDTLKDEEFTVLAVDLRENKKVVRSFMKEYEIDFPVYLDSAGEISSMYSVGGIPTTYIIGPEGNVIGRAIGPRPWGEEVSVEFMRSLMPGDRRQ
jgi:peroxiredoxin